MHLSRLNEVPVHGPKNLFYRQINPGGPIKGHADATHYRYYVERFGVIPPPGHPTECVPGQWERGFGENLCDGANGNETLY